MPRRRDNDFDNPDFDEPEDGPYDDMPDYEDIAAQSAPRDVAMPAGTAEPGARPRTLIEQLEGAADVTDMQAALRMLFPSDLGTAEKIAGLTMVSRIAPEVFLPMIELLSVDEVMRSDPKQPIDVIATRMKYYGLVSIGLDGRGRIDIAEAIGASREVRRDEGMGRMNF